MPVSSRSLIRAICAITQLLFGSKDFSKSVYKCSAIQIFGSRDLAHFEAHRRLSSFGVNQLP
ncbi:hypothetical protein DOTSEDRAFT_68264 [Dothistroma septosporum NZE10]|uniref:Uncharacterized protein n=1 Tax=Dothistroma septosporum (strain NZE10 / CBS 128990) TaxID=675120 RepID=N1Q409_DOTSN|nr:hypothetical protein DOTSEDRAFT_68264 [Dothistroma septosporum NZE10]